MIFFLNILNYVYDVWCVEKNQKKEKKDFVSIGKKKKKKVSFSVSFLSVLSESGRRGKKKSFVIWI